MMSVSRSADAGRLRPNLRGEAERASSNLSWLLLFSVSLMEDGDKYEDALLPNNFDAYSTEEGLEKGLKL